MKYVLRNRQPLWLFTAARSINFECRINFFFFEIAAYVQLNVDISQLYITFFPAIESFTNLFLLSGKGKVIKSRQ